MKKRFTIGKKLFLGFGIISFLLFAFGVLVVLRNGINLEQSKKITHVFLPSSDYIEEYQNMLYKSKDLIKNIIFFKNASVGTEKTKINHIININYPKIKTELRKLSYKWDENDRVLLNKINAEISDSLFTDYKRILVTIEKEIAKSTDETTLKEKDITQCTENDLAEIYEKETLLEDSIHYTLSEVISKFQPEGEISKIYNSIQKKVSQLNNNLNKVTNKSNLKMIYEFEFAQKIVIGIILFFILIAITTSYITTKSITKPLKKLQIVLNKMGKGELPELKIEDASDEIGDMTFTLSEVTNKLRKIIIDIKNSSEKLSTLSQSLSKRSIQISHGATEQAASVEEVSASIEQMISNIEQNMENANIAETIVNTAVDKIKDNNKNVSETVTALEEILKKVTIISDIAFQTNILSLNASIEAARAGKKGKGFAIVATEVGHLAEKSQNSSEEIEEISETSIQIAKITGTMSAALIPEIQETENLIKQVSLAGRELSNGVNQINSSVEQLNNVTQQNALFSEEMSQGASELALHAEQLLKGVDFFKIEDKLIDKEITENIEKDDIEAIKNTIDKKSKTDKGFNIDLGKVTTDDDFEVF